ncbi:MAG: RNA polymerase sigma factor, partial [Bacteroidota bacterium]
PVHDQFERFCRARAYYDMPHDDLMNETLLVAFKKIDQLKNERAFLGFLIGISTRILANAKKKHRPSSLEIDLNNYEATTRGVEEQLEVAFLHQSLAQLPALQREALILFEITGFSIKEIADLQQSSISAVKQRLARGRVALATIVEKAQMVRH